MKSLAWFLLTLAFLLVASVILTTWVVGFDPASTIVAGILVAASLKVFLMCYRRTL
jgi:hypothetical protein